jgi:hypothetical protein
MLECFDYTPMTEDEVRRRFILSPRATECEGVLDLVTYDDTECFALRSVNGGQYRHESDSFVTAVVTRDGGELRSGGGREKLSRGEKYFIPAGAVTEFDGASVILCYPPKIK